MTSRKDIECPTCGNRIELAVLHVEPGDTVVFTYHDALTSVHAESIRVQLRGAFGPDINPVVVSGGGRLHKESP